MMKPHFTAMDLMQCVEAWGAYGSLLVRITEGGHECPNPVEDDRKTSNSGRQMTTLLCRKS
jgi:hypothetical protein